MIRLPLAWAGAEGDFASGQAPNRDFLLAMQASFDQDQKTLA